MSGLDILGYSSFVVSLIGILLNAKKKIACWPVWLVSNAGWMVYSLIEKDVPSMILWIAFSAFNVYGWIQWRKDKVPFKPFTGNYNI
jgi:nicotinamide mononucleotide transporter